MRGGPYIERSSVSLTCAGMEDEIDVLDAQGRARFVCGIAEPHPQDRNPMQMKAYEKELNQDQTHESTPPRNTLPRMGCATYTDPPPPLAVTSLPRSDIGVSRTQRGV